MVFKDLVVIGVCKLLRLLDVETLVVDKINEVNKAELDTLSGLSGNIQSQISSINGDVSTAQTLRDAFKSGIASAINDIPKPNAKVLSSGSTLSEMTAEAVTVKDNINAAESNTALILKGHKFVNNQGAVVDGTMADFSNAVVKLSCDSLMECDTYLKEFLRIMAGYKPGYYTTNTSLYIDLDYSAIADAIRLDPSYIIEDYSVLGKQGTIMNMATRYDIGIEKVYGCKLSNMSHKQIWWAGGQSPDSNNYFVCSMPTGYYQLATTYLGITFQELAGLIGVDANYMLNDKSVLGITGSIQHYTGTQITSSYGVRESGDLNLHKIWVKMPIGAYTGQKVSGYWECGVNFSDIVNALHTGVDASKIISGYSILGVSGTAGTYDSGYSNGYNDGKSAGNSEGYNNGYSAGHTDGYNSGNSDGYNSGYSAGDSAGYSRGYGEGQSNGISTERNDMMYYIGFCNKYNVLPGLCSLGYDAIRRFENALTWAINTGHTVSPHAIGIWYAPRGDTSDDDLTGKLMMVNSDGVISTGQSVSGWSSYHTYWDGRWHNKVEIYGGYNSYGPFSSNGTNDGQGLTGVAFVDFGRNGGHTLVIRISY